MTLTGAQFEITGGGYRANLIEVGGGLRGLWRGEREVAATFPPDVLVPKCCGTTLVPWPNRIRDGRYSFAGADYRLPITEPPPLNNASHGLARWARWTAVEEAADHVRLEIDLVPQGGYPFEVRCGVEYRVDADGLTVTATAENHGRTAAPFGYGAHPYLAIGDTPLADVQLRVPAQTWLTVDEQKIPTGRIDVAGTSYDLRQLTPLGELRLDECFVDVVHSGGIGSAEVVTGAGATTLWFDEAITALQVFTPDVLVDGHTAVAVEPMSCPADAFNSGTGLVRLEPGATWTAQWGITAT